MHPLPRRGTLSLFALLVLCAILSLPSLATVSSTTYIEAGKTFMLGGEQSSAFTAEGRNTGPVPVEVLLSGSDGERSVAVAKPGKSFSLEVPARHTALFRNKSERKATLRFELTGKVSGLSMRYD
jgi:hypothetical protein